MDVTLLGMTIEIREVQEANALSPIETTPFEIAMDVREVQEANA